MTTAQQNHKFDTYLTHLKTLASYCALGDLEDEMILLQIVLGINEDAFQEWLLQEPKLTLDMAIKFVRAAKYSKKQLQMIKSGARKGIRRRAKFCRNCLFVPMQYKSEVVQ